VVTVYKIHMTGKGYVDSGGHPQGTDFTCGATYSNIGPVKAQLRRLRRNFDQPWRKKAFGLVEFKACAFEVPDMPSRVLDL